MDVQGCPEQARSRLHLRWQQDRLVRSCWIWPHLKSEQANNLRSPSDFKQELRINVNLDEERGERPRPNHDNIHKVRIVKAKNEKINMATIQAYLDGKIDFDNSVLEAISRCPSCIWCPNANDSDFLDHLLRETPSKKLINLRRSYFARTGESQDRSLLGGGIEAMKGVYQSLRMAEVCSFLVKSQLSLLTPLRASAWSSMLTSQTHASGTRLALISWRT